MSSAVRAVTLLMLLCPGGVTAQSYDDPRARDYTLKAKRNMGITPREDCGQPDKDGAIVVCGRRGQNPDRLPLPEERAAPGERVHDSLPSGVAATNARPYKCGVSGQGEVCNGGLSMFSAALVAAKLLTKMIDPEAQMEPPAKIPDRYRGSNK